MAPDPALTLDQRIRRAAPYMFGNPRWTELHDDEFEQIIRWRTELPQPPEAWWAQAMAAQTFDVEARLHQITSPTLIITASEDRVVPPRNAELLAARIPSARLDVIKGAGHLVFIEEAERFNADVIGFLAPSPPDPLSRISGEGETRIRNSPSPATHRRSDLRVRQLGPGGER
jgi:pimeloyl-ACP methyl ester carboxylesterase